MLFEAEGILFGSRMNDGDGESYFVWGIVSRDQGSGGWKWFCGCPTGSERGFSDVCAELDCVRVLSGRMDRVCQLKKACGFIHCFKSFQSVFIVFRFVLF